MTAGFKGFAGARRVLPGLHSFVAEGVRRHVAPPGKLRGATRSPLTTPYTVGGFDDGGLSGTGRGQPRVGTSGLKAGDAVKRPYKV